MKIGKYFLVWIIFISMPSWAHAGGSDRPRHLSAQEIERVRALKGLLSGIDTKSLRETINELERSSHPLVSLEMKEAMARAYSDIVSQINVEGQKKKEWLYSMVCLNMAYLQFGGAQGKPGSTTELNRLIRKKLKEHLPSNILNQPGFLHSLE